MKIRKGDIHITLVILLQYVWLVTGVSVSHDLSLTQQQKTTMDKFKRLMIPKLPHKYMQEEIYLVRWLRARNFDIKRAEQFLLENLKWRKENKMDTIQEEDWSDIQNEFPYYIDGLDKTGRPIITAFSKEWDIRNSVVTGRVKRVLRFLDKAMEEAAGMVRESQLSGKNVTQFVFVMHLGTFNLFQHACPRCITSILEFLSSYERHYPGWADKIIFIQTPPAFEIIAKALRETMSPQAREAMKIYPTDPSIWKKALLNFIEPDQLTIDFGGTKPDKIYQP